MEDLNAGIWAEDHPSSGVSIISYPGRKL